jgi:hypothetical protein
MEVPLHQRNTMAELQLLLDEYQLDFENPEEIRGQDLHEPFIIPVTIDAETQTLDLLIMTKAGALKMVTAADTFGIVVHCDTTFNIFNSEQIAGGFGSPMPGTSCIRPPCSSPNRRASTPTSTRGS